MHVSAACRHWYLRFFSWKPVGRISLRLLQAWIWPQEIAEYFLVGEKKKKGERGKRKDKTLFSQLTFSAANCIFFFFSQGQLTSGVCNLQTKNWVPQNETTSWKDVSAYALCAAMLFLSPIHCRVSVILMSVVRIIVASRWNTVINKYLRLQFTLLSG